MADPMFPILSDPILRAIPWAAIAPHEAQAQRNHSQTLKGLAGRGGLGISEAYYILSDKPHPWPPRGGYSEFEKAAFRSALMSIVRNFERDRSQPRPDLRSGGLTGC